MTPAKRRELMGIRRDLISGLKNLEDAMELPPEKRAIRTRVDKRVDNQVIYTQKKQTNNS